MSGSTGSTSAQLEIIVSESDLLYTNRQWHWIQIGFDYLRSLVWTDLMTAQCSLCVTVSKLLTWGKKSKICTAGLMFHQEWDHKELLQDFNSDKTRTQWLLFLISSVVTQWRLNDVVEFKWNGLIMEKHPPQLIYNSPKEINQSIPDLVNLKKI